MIIRENKIKKRALRCRSRAALIDNKLVFLLIIASVGFPHGNVKFCQTFISFIDFLLFYFSCELWLLLKPFCRTKYSPKVTKSCRHFEAKKCKQKYHFSVNCVTCKSDILSTYLTASLQIL